jgi:hypothetical protein
MIKKYKKINEDNYLKTIQVANDFSLLIKKIIIENLGNFERLLMHNLLNKIRGYSTSFSTSEKNDTFIINEEVISVFSVNKYCKKEYFEFFIDIQNDIYVMHFQKSTGKIIFFSNFIIDCSFFSKDISRVIIENNLAFIMTRGFSTMEMEEVKLQDCLILNKINLF